MPSKNLVYKFRHWDNPVHQRILTHNEIYYASPRSLNDPLDCQVPIRYDLLNEDQHYQIIRSHLIRDNPNWSQQKIDEEALKWIERALYKDPAHLKRCQILDEKFKDEFFGVFSLADKLNIEKLWSRYANGHKGFCMAFDKEELLRFAENQAKKFKISIDDGYIDYYEEFPVLKPEGINDTEFIRRSLFIKSKQWEYENEFRLLLQDVINVNRRSFILDNEMISQIILGYMIPESHKIEIINIISSRKPKPILLQAKVKGVESGLDFEEIKY